MRRRWIVLMAGLVVILTVGAAVTYRLRFESLPPDTVADRILLDKSSRRLTLFHDGKALKSYSVALGRQPIGPKEFEGDGKTPEGEYAIDWRKDDSGFHLALHVSYPRPSDFAEAQAAGKSPGGAIMIHGIRNGLGLVGPLHRILDWTDGCVAVTNAEMEELWRSVPDGTPIEIRP